MQKMISTRYNSLPLKNTINFGIKSFRASITVLFVETNTISRRWLLFCLNEFYCLFAFQFNCLHSMSVQPIKLHLIFCLSLHCFVASKVFFAKWKKKRVCWKNCSVNLNAMFVIFHRIFETLMLPIHSA